MSTNSSVPLALDPVISYPKVAEVGKSYMLTIDLQLPEDFPVWPYNVEEYPVYCMLDTAPLFTNKPVERPVLVLHRFGGTYGPIKFILRATGKEVVGHIRIIFANKWGVPLRTVTLPETKIVSTVDDVPTADMVLQEEIVPSIDVRLHNIPRLPRHYLPRSEEIAALKEKVLSKQQSPIAITGKRRVIGVQGMGGIGKSVLAAALAYEEDVQAAFADGIFWITLGQNLTEAELIRHQVQLASTLGREVVAFQDWREGKAYLRNLFTNKACLIILDDVWAAADAAKFDVVNDLSFVLITTRNHAVVEALGAEELSLDVLDDRQALALLAKTMSKDMTIEQLPDQANDIIREFGHLPLAIVLIGGVIANISASERDPWDYVLNHLRATDLRRISQSLPDFPYPTLLAALETSLAALNQDETLASLNPVERYFDLAIFPEDLPIPERALILLWQSVGLDERESSELIRAFSRLSLAERPDDGLLQLHELLRDYIRQKAQDKKTRHERLLKAYFEECEDSWASGPDDGYFFQQLPYHLLQAEREQELQDLLLSIDWIQKKLTTVGVFPLIADYDLLSSAESTKTLSLVQGALRLSAHILSRDTNQLVTQLLARLPSSTEDTGLRKLIAQLEAWEGGAWLRSLHSTLSPSGGSLHLTFAGHNRRYNQMLWIGLRKRGGVSS